MFISLMKEKNKLLKEINSLLSKGMPNIYLILSKTDVLKTSIFWISFTSHFWGAPAHSDIIEYSNFLLQLKNQRTMCKIVCGFSIVFISKGIMAF